MARKSTRKRAAAKKSSAPRKTAKSPTPAEPVPPTVRDAIVALQKTFSRVSRDSNLQKVEAGAARALVVGQVDFEIDLRVTLAPQDHLVLVEEGGSPLKLKGTIATDLRTDDED